MLSIPHLVVIFLVALVIFGPQKLPELARNLGRIVGEFRRATNDLRGTFEEHMRELEREAQMIEQKKQDLMRVHAEVNSTLEAAKAVQANTAAAQRDPNLPPALPAGASLADTFEEGAAADPTMQAEEIAYNAIQNLNTIRNPNPDRIHDPDAIHDWDASGVSETDAHDTIGAPIAAGSEQETAPAEPPLSVAEHGAPAIPGTVPARRPNDVPENNRRTTKPAEDPAQDDVHVS